MVESLSSGLVAADTGWYDVLNYEIITGNAAWRLGLLLLAVLSTIMPHAVKPKGASRSSVCL